MAARPKCGSCGHAEHKNACRAKAGSGCQPFGRPASSETTTGIACGARPPCPCPWRVCKCGALVACAWLEETQAQAFAKTKGIQLLADELGAELERIEVPIVRGTSNDPAGRLEVWIAAGGQLWCRELSPGEEPAAGRWRGVEHTGKCQPL